MQTKDFVVANGYKHIHLSVNDDQSVCYIFVNDIYNECLTMRFFIDMPSALNWINTHCE